MADLGVGTFEVAQVMKSDTPFSSSLPTGADLIYWRYADPDGGKWDRQAAQQEVERHLASATLPRTAATVFVGGTARTLAELEGKPRLRLERMRDLEPLFANGVSLFNIDPDRARVLPAGTYTIRRYLELTGGGDLMYSRPLERIRAGLCSTPRLSDHANPQADRDRCCRPGTIRRAATAM